METSASLRRPPSTTRRAGRARPNLALLRRVGRPFPAEEGLEQGGAGLALAAGVSPRRLFLFYDAAGAPELFCGELPLFSSAHTCASINSPSLSLSLPGLEQHQFAVFNASC
jgi:hypothetical protein